ncbi:MAG: LacI family DNA-binding transcriptional regulator [Bacteroidota bacterium]
MTLAEIANKANVSITTAHRVFSGKSDVHPETFRKIMKIARENGYTHSQKRKRNRDDKSLVHAKSGTVSLLLSGLPSEYLQLPQNLKFVSFLEHSLSSHDFSLSIAQDPDSDNENFKKLISSGKTDGLIVMGDVPSRARALVSGFPCVGIFGSNYYDEPRIDWILPDYQARARMAVDYFFKLGIRKIAFLNPIAQHSGFNDVESEFTRYAYQKNLVPTSLSVVEPFKESIYKKEKGRKIVKTLIENMISLPEDNKPTGIFVANDEVAMDVYSELTIKGIAIGRDITILSSDNTDIFLDRLSPRPASIDLNYLYIAESAVERLIKRIENPMLETGVRILIPPKIVEPHQSNSKTKQL